MQPILCVEPSASVKKTLVTLLENRSGRKVFTASNGNDAVSFLERKKFDLIISENKMPSGDGEYLYWSAREVLDLDTPIVFFASTPLPKMSVLAKQISQDQNASYAKKATNPKMIKDFLFKVDSTLKERDKLNQIHEKIGGKEDWNFDEQHNSKIKVKSDKKENPSQEIRKSFEKNEENQKTKWVQFESRKLLPIRTSPCDLYIQLGKEKFVKICHENDPIATDFLMKYIDKGMKFILVEETDAEKVRTAISDLLLGALAKNLESNVAQMGQLVAYDFVNSQMAQMGMNQTTVKLAQKTVQSVLDTIERAPSLWRILENSLREKNYISEHCLMISYISNYIAKKLGHSETTILEKLSMAAMLHDAFIDDERLAKINTKLALNDLNSEDRGTVLGHIDKAVKALSKLESFQPDIDVILSQHHERPMGKGFPKGLNSKQVSPLAAIFIVSEFFVEELLRNGFNPMRVDEILTRMERGFSSGRYEKPYKALISLMKKS
ncbi:MAG: HD domain-containing phosphohydrolase [Bacteriovoracaceae bacterium]